MPSPLPSRDSAASTDGAAGGSAVSRSPHWPALDGWRGFTIWFAISVHAGYFTAGGVLSLDTFFVLSGFLITGLLLREWQRGEHIDLLRFWARRARRLLPALFVVLTAVVIYAAFLAPTLGVATVRGDLLTSVFYVVNWHFIFSGQSYFSAFTTPSPVLHLWSLAVEEQFYFVWPLLVLATLWAARRRVGRTGAITAVGVVALVGAIASSVWMVHLYVPGGDPSRVYYGTDTRAQAMLLGAALAVFVLVHGPLRSRAGRVALQLAAPLCLVVVIAPWFASDATAVHDVFYGQFGLFAYCIATSVVLWRLVQPSAGLLGAGLSLSPVRWVGAISYEMYLWHWPTYLVLTSGRTGLDGYSLLAVRLGAVVGLAWLTHTFVAEPIRRGVTLRSPRLARAAMAAMVIALSVSVFAATLDAQPALTGQTGDVAFTGPPPTLPKTTPTTSTPSSNPKGTSTPAAPTTTMLTPLKVLVVGDSQAATMAQGIHANPGVNGLTAQPGLAVWDRSILGCEMSTFPNFMIDGNVQANRCGGSGLYQQQWAGDVAQFRPDVVVLMAGAWDVFDVAMPGGGTMSPGDPAWNAQYDADMGKLFDLLGSTGATVVAIRPPCWGHNTVDGTQPERPERLDAGRVAAVGASWVRAAATHGATILDLNSTLCPGGVADPSLRPDGAHFYGHGSDVMGPLVAQGLRKAYGAR